MLINWNDGEAISEAYDREAEEMGGGMRFFLEKDGTVYSLGRMPISEEQLEKWNVQPTDLKIVEYNEVSDITGVEFFRGKKGCMSTFLEKDGVIYLLFNCPISDDRLADLQPTDLKIVKYVVRGKGGDYQLIDKTPYVNIKKEIFSKSLKPKTLPAPVTKKLTGIVRAVKELWLEIKK